MIDEEKGKGEGDREVLISHMFLSLGQLREGVFYLMFLFLKLFLFSCSFPV